MLQMQQNLSLEVSEQILEGLRLNLKNPNHTALLIMAVVKDKVVVIQAVVLRAEVSNKVADKLTPQNPKNKPTGTTVPLSSQLGFIGK